MKNRELARGFLTWQESHEQRKAALALLKRAAGPMKQVLLAKGWRTWLDNYQEALRIAGLIHAVALRVCKAGEVKAFSQWIQWLGEWRESAERRRKVRNFANRMANPRLLVAFVVAPLRCAANRAATKRGQGVGESEA